jgi:fructoselysine-6-P-deglycase FrlB-like protein
VALRADDVPAAWLDAGAFVVAAMRLDAAEGLVGRIRGTIVLDTHEDWVGDAGRVLALASRVAVFCPSRDELAELAGFDDPERSAPAFAAATGTPLVAKLGADGCLVALPDGGLWRMPSVATSVVDPTGAGDAFCGGLAAGLAGGLDVVEAARRASASAAFAVAGSGSLRFHELGSPPALPEAVRVPAPAAAADGRSIGVMAGEIESIPRVISDQLELLDEPISALVAELEERGIEHVFLTGCGDSAFAGQAAALCFSRFIDARAVHALDLARYERLPPNSAIVCVSYSGKVGRTIEAARRGFSIALTGGPDTPLAGGCDRVLTLTVPTRGLSPGTSTYVAMVTALADLALHWGGKGRGELPRAPELARATLQACWEPARALGRRLAGQPWICVVGGGPNEASARFGAAKFLEGAQVLGTATNVEEWAHEEYFVTRPGAPVIVVAPAGSVSDRVADVLDELVGLGADPVLVSDREAPAGVTWLPLAPGLPEELSPLLAALPLSVVAFSLAEVTGKRSYNFAGPEAEARHYRTIHAVGAPV